MALDAITMRSNGLTISVGWWPVTTPPSPRNVNACRLVARCAASSAACPKRSIDYRNDRETLEIFVSDIMPHFT
jgi:hypothetical protein